MKSLVSVSTHKAGSTIANQIINMIASAKGYQSDLISQKAANSPEPLDEFYVQYQKHIQPFGFYYGMLRGLYVKDMKAIYGLKTIVQIRDPRDCITSFYYSLGISHAMPPNEKQAERLQATRDKIQNTELGDFALKQSYNYRQRLLVLDEIISNHDDIVVLKYEDMVENTEVWLSNIADFLGQPLTPKLQARLDRKLDFDAVEEDPTKHKRQVNPGDYKRKLSSGTIEQMNEVLGQMLQRFNYAVR